MFLTIVQILEIDSHVNMSHGLMDTSGSSPEKVNKYTCKDFSDIAECFSRLEANVKFEVSKLSEEMKDVRKKVSQLETCAEYVTGEIKQIYDEKLPNIEGAIEDESKRRLELEWWGRKWNLVFRGIPGQLNEKPTEMDKVIREFLVSKLKLDDVSIMLFQAVHRLPSGPSEKRGIVVRFNSLIDRDRVFAAAVKLPKGSGYGVTPNLPPSAAQHRAKLLQDLKSMDDAERKTMKLVYMKTHPFVALRPRK